MEAQNTQEDKNQKMTLTIWDYNQYTNSVLSSNKYKKEDYKQRVMEAKREVAKAKALLQETISQKPTIAKPNYWDYKKEVIAQRERAKERDYTPLENDDSIKIDTAQQLIDETEQEPYTIDELLSKVARGQK